MTSSRRRDARWRVGAVRLASTASGSSTRRGRARPAARRPDAARGRRVGGEPLAVEALASALGQVFRAEPEPGRVAVAMSGGVDSAVALLRAGAERDRRHAPSLAGPRRAVRRASVLLTGGRRRGAATCHALGLPARHARPARGVPRGRRRIRSRTATRRGRRRTRACAATARSASTRCSRSHGARERTTLWTGHYARVVERDGPAPRRARRRPGKDQSYMLSTLDPCTARPRPLPARRPDEGRDAGRGGTRRARRGGALGEPGGVLPRWRRLPRLPRAPGSRAPRGRSSTRRGRELGRHDGYWRFTPGQRRGLGVVAARGRCTCCGRTARRTRSSSAPASRSRRRGRGRGVACMSRWRVAGRSFATARRRCPRP